MGIRLDVVISAMIVGILTLLIFGVNSFILQNSVDTRLYNDMQMFADLSTDIFQEELKSAVMVLEPVNSTTPSNELRFVSVNGDTVEVRRDGRLIEFTRRNKTENTETFELNLSAIEFDLEPDTTSSPYYLNIRFQTESSPEQHASSKKDIETVNAFSQRRYYLRNVHLVGG